MKTSTAEKLLPIYTSHLMPGMKAPDGYYFCTTKKELPMPLLPAPTFWDRVADFLWR